MGFQAGFHRASLTRSTLSPAIASPSCFDKGYNAGFNSGFNRGFNVGFVRGFDTGFNRGFRARLKI